ESTPKNYFTLGSTKDEVLRIQGEPRSFTDSEWSYGGYSSVYFEGDRVRRWSTGSTPLKARLVPSGPPPSLDYFTVGSTKDDVLQIQGEPRWFTDGEWSYGGYSSVYFEGDRVARWSTGSVTLRARLVPSGPPPSRDYFTVGSTKDEVLQIQGEPRWFTDGEWSYGGYSSVYFDGYRVARWWTGRVTLKARLVPSGPPPSRDYFTVGSTKDEVLQIQGEPRWFTDGEWSYGGYSSV